jgi:hypothetical protein
MNDTQEILDDTTLTFDQWLENVEKMQRLLPSAHNTFLDIPSVKYLETVVAGFMAMPVGLYQGQVLTCKTMRCDDISEFRSYVTNLGKPVILYQALWCPVWPLFKGNHIDTFEPVDFDPPKFASALMPRESNHWRIRFAVVGEG